ncbi:MAG: hypothetical protein ACREFO_18180 [Acetobacteraceae bacterium]
MTRLPCVRAGLANDHAAVLIAMMPLSSLPHWTRIEASTGNLALTQPVRARYNVASWRFATAAALVPAAVLAGLLISRPTPRRALMATIAPTGKTVPILIAEVQPGGARTGQTTGLVVDEESLSRID